MLGKIHIAVICIMIWYEVTLQNSILLLPSSVCGGSNPETLVSIYQITCCHNQQTTTWRQEIN